MLYATGSRIKALLTLRLKDLDLRSGLVTFRYDKGGKTRTVRLAQSLMPSLLDHVEWVKGRWENDNKAGVIAPCDDESLMRKLGRSTFSKLPWYWLFPSQVVRGQERWHATDRGLCKAISKAATEAGITKRVTAHTFRHSHATALLHRGENIRTIQKQLGHSQVETTEIYTHATSGPVMSPMDQPNVIPVSFGEESEFKARVK
jgi:site-specific recombinase XerD